MTIEVLSVGPEGEARKLQFAFDLAVNGESAFNEYLQQFCRIELGDQHRECTELIRNRFVTEYVQNSIPPFLQPDAVATSFSEELIPLACPHSGGESYASCAAGALQAIRSVKVMTMGSLMNTLRDIVTANTLVPVATGWTEGIEGNLLMYLDKVAVFQALADDRRVETICEVGFNLGHSAVNWMSANPVAKVLAFDVSRHTYTAAAINAIGEMFPNRTINLVEGDSRRTVPNFAKMFDIRKGSRKGFKCNLILIDAAHDFIGAYSDIINFANFANESYHRVIIDDLSVADVEVALERSVDEGVLTLGEKRSTPQTLCHIAAQVLQGPYIGAYAFREMTAEENCQISGESGAEDIIYVGEYVV